MSRAAQMVLLAVLLAASAAEATKPCGNNTWYADHHRPEAVWQKDAAMVFTGKIVAMDEHIEPYANCGLTDRSQCAMDDRSVVTVAIDQWQKGAIPYLKTIRLAPGFCAQPPAKQIGNSYRFYTNTYDAANGTAYLFYAPLDAAAKP